MGLGNSQRRGPLAVQQVQPQLPLYQAQPGLSLKPIYARLTQGHVQANATAQPALPERISLADGRSSKVLRHKGTYERAPPIGFKK
jgi:hypothetical protein